MDFYRLKGGKHGCRAAAVSAILFDGVWGGVNVSLPAGEIAPGLPLTAVRLYLMAAM